MADIAPMLGAILGISKTPKGQDKKRAKKSSRARKKAAGFAAARRFAVKQADSLLKRLRGKKHR